MSTLIKKVTTEILGKYFTGEIEDKGADSSFVLRNFKTPRKSTTSPSVLSVTEVVEMIAELNEVKDILNGVIPPVVIPTLVKALNANDERFANYSGASEALSDLSVIVEDNVYKITGAGKPVTSFAWYWGSNAEQEANIYFAVEIMPPSNVTDTTKAVIKTFNIDSSEKIAKFTDFTYIQRITADNKVTGREIAVAWDGVNFEPIKLDFTGVTGL